ncbi:RsmB/NOP family class I SAM-dependent RNA methyltransferase [Paenibacillus sp. 1P07SE]|uniref:RsmB/NOP family class I SAM-dependent RNA methyltransferase n=1 Tax=Paenibacillus sp. 1P07SE TaxID=3132209 RepID=UPI0039A722B0
MEKTLPQPFVDQMHTLLGEQIDAFLASYSEERRYGLRINRLKLSAEEFRRLAPFGERLEPVPWSEDGYYYQGDADRPGKHPLYHAGLYYIQEPSAMAPVALLDVQPGHRVLDLCAAPGGKSTQIAARLQGKGLLVANDNAAERAKALAKNIERAGVRNAVVLQEEPASLARVFHRYFDRILVDAPCSGEGMFRKEPGMIAYWGKHDAARYAAMQDDILLHAAAMLAPGGRLVYSTCTFTPEENEHRIAALLHSHPRLDVIPVQPDHGWQPGFADVSGGIDHRLEGTVRLWPHHVQGEGHYAAVLAADLQDKQGTGSDASPPAGLGTPEQPSAPLRTSSRELRRDRQQQAAVSGRAVRADRRRGSRKEAPDLASAEAQWQTFAEHQLTLQRPLAGRLTAYGSRLYLQPHGLPALDGLRVIRAGWYIGEAGRHRFEPSQALALGLTAAEAARVLDLRAEDDTVWRYLRGETLEIDREQIKGPSGADADEPKGLVLVCVAGYPLGWGRWQDGVLKNELAPGWRIV